MADIDNYTITYKDNIFYYTFINELSISTILAAENEVADILYEKHIRLAPAIVTFQNVDHGHISLGITDLSKIVAMRNIMQSAAGLWIVGAEKQTKRMAQILSSTFLRGQCFLVSTLDEANAAAKASLARSESILDEHDDKPSGV
jgi:hypothetical protein